MIAAVYARKSTDQNGVADEEKSVTRQVEHAREYGTKRGWTVVNEHVYRDDGVSGAEFVRREGLNALLAALDRRPPFDVLIISEDSRLGRGSIDTAVVIRKIIESGVRIFAYLDDREITLGSAMDTLLLSIRSFQSEAEREQAAKRTHDALRRKAGKGHVTGGRLFGYDNVAGPDGTVTRIINEAQAAIVRRLFELYADGLGFKRIAERLNLESISGPRGGRWQHSAVRELLHNPLFGGMVVWNRTRRTVRKGKTNVKVRRDASEAITVERPELRIAPGALLARVRARLDANASAYARGEGGKLAGRPALRDLESKHLLVGFARCTRCGAHLIASPRANKPKNQPGGKLYAYYRCSAASSSGRAVCTMPSIRSDRIEPAVLSALQFHLGEEKLNEVFASAIAETKRRHRGDDLEARRVTVQAALTKLAAEKQKLLKLIQEADEPPSFILARGKDIEIEERRLRGDLDTIARAGLEVEEAALSKVRTKVESLRKLLAAPVAQARSALRRLRARVALSYQVLDGAVNWHFGIAGTFAGLAEGSLVLVPIEEEPGMVNEFLVVGTDQKPCAGTVVPGEGVEPSHVLRRSGF